MLFYYLIEFYLFISIQILLEKLIHNTKWSFEVSGAYIRYSSITEKRTSVRGNFNAKLDHLSVLLYMHL